MIRKNYILPEEVINIIHEVKEEEFLGTETQALLFIIKEYKKQKNQAKEMVEEFNSTNKAWMERVKWAATTAEKNTIILMDIANTFLELNSYQYCITTEAHKSPVIEQSEEKIKETINYFKQQKDERERKKLAKEREEGK